MAALFPKWADSLVRSVLVGCGALGMGTPLFLMAWARSPEMTGADTPLEQPVKFDHRHHVRDDADQRIRVLLVSGHAVLPQIAAQMGTRYFLRKGGDTANVLDKLDLRQRLAPSSA